MATVSKTHSSATATRRIRKWTTLDELEQEDKGRVFVINNSEGAQRGMILIPVQKQNGKSELVRVPKTYIPVDLTQQITKKALLESSEFRRTVMRGLIQLVSSEYATYVLSTEEGKAEKQRIDNEMKAAQQSVLAATTMETDGKPAKDDDDGFVEVEDVKAELKTKAVQTATADQKVKQMCADAVHEEWDQLKIVNWMRSYGKMTTADLRYVNQRLGDKPKVAKFMKSLAQ
jgi:hypothetical protein